MLDSRINKALQSLQQSPLVVPPLAPPPPSSTTTTFSSPRSSAPSTDSNTTPAKCRPLSFEDFSSRLATFANVTNWFAKPTCISPAVCARYGWRSAGVDLLECSACNAALSFRTPAVTAQSTVEQLAAQWASQLVAAGHKPFCPWTQNPSPEAFTTCFPHGPPNHASVADELLDRWNSLVNSITPAQLPPLASAFWSAQLITQAWLSKPVIMQRLTEMALSISATRGAAAAAYTARWRDYAALALFGWRVRAGTLLAHADQPLAIHCSVCCRDVGLWNFASPTAAPAASAIGSASSVVSSAAAATPPPPTPRPSLHSSVADLPVLSSELRVSRDASSMPIVMGSFSIPSPTEGASTPPHTIESRGSHVLRSSTAVLATKRPAPPTGEQQDDMTQEEEHGDSVLKKLRHARTELNPAKEHRWFCPWVYGQQAGWQHLLQLLAATDATSTTATESAAEHGLLAMVNLNPSVSKSPH